MEESPLDHALQLFDIAGPAAACQHFQRFGGQVLLGHVVLGAHFRQDMVGQDGNILYPLPQRRDAHDCIQHHLKQLAAEKPLVRQALQIAVAGGNHADVQFLPLPGSADGQAVL